MVVLEAEVWGGGTGSGAYHELKKPLQLSRSDRVRSGSDDYYYPKHYAHLSRDDAASDTADYLQFTIALAVTVTVLVEWPGARVVWCPG